MSLLDTLTNITNIPATLKGVDMLMGKAEFTDVTASEEKTSKVSYAVKYIIGIIIGFYCVYLSWNCNTNQGYSVFAKVIFAFFAYGFGFLYLIYYGLFRAGTCSKPIFEHKSNSNSKSKSKSKSKH
jgi:hypothetical protein